MLDGGSTVSILTAFVTQQSNPVALSNAVKQY